MVLGGAATARAHEPDGVRVVDHDERVVALGEVADAGKRREMTVHREHAVGDDDAAPCVRRLAQPGLKVGEVTVAVTQPPGLAQADAVDEGGVVELIGDDGVLAVEERLEDAGVGVEARREQDRGLGAQEGAQCLLKLDVRCLGAADEPHAGHPEPPLPQSVPRGRDDARVVGEPE
jgi:hypothetical protein